MARRANTTLIGLFIVGAVILVISAALLFGSGLLRDKSRFVMFFSGSVKGLSIGAPVNFRGVKIGTVTDIRLLLDPDTQQVQIPVYVELDPARFSLMSGEKMNKFKMRKMDEMIKNGLRAQLQSQSLLTGQLAIQLDIYPDKPATLVGTNENITEIPTIPSPLQEITRKIEEFPIDTLLHDVANATQGIDKLVNNPELPAAIKQFNETMQHYSALSDQYIALAQRLDQRSEQISTDLNVTLKELHTTLQSTHDLIRSGATVMNNSNELMQQLRLNAGHLTTATAETLGALKQTSDSVNQLLGAESPLQYQLSQTLNEISRSARALRSLANTLEENPQAVIRGKPEDGDQ